MKKILYLSIMCLLITAEPAWAETPSKGEAFLVPSPCPESYQPCCTDFNAICNNTMLKSLTGLKPGQKVAVLLPDYLSLGSPGDIGYYAHALAMIVGKSGHVYTVTPPEIAEAGNSGSTTMHGRTVAGDYGDANVTQLIIPFSQLATLPKLDLVWAAMQAYRPLSFFKPLEQRAFAPVAESLNPRGRFIVLETDTQVHCGRPSAECPDLGPILLQDKPHEIVLQMIQDAGFHLLSEYRRIYDPSLRPPMGGGPMHGLADGTYTRSYPFMWVLQRSAK